jgi:hypothetical protein
MIWLTWRQSRAALATTAAALALLAAVLAVTGPGIADDYSTGVAGCGGNCADFIQRFFAGNQGGFLAATAVVLVLPALIGLFWGAPLITRELEAGTHHLVWTQSITRTRWLAVKLALAGGAVMVAAGLASLAVSWWAHPLDKASGESFPRMAPLLFDTRGIVPIGYAAFAFALGVTVGMLVRRTLPAMALTLVAFLAVQVAMPRFVRPHLIPPVRALVEITPASLDGLQAGPGGPIRVSARPNDASAWVLSSHTVDKSGHAVETVPLSPDSGRCQPQPGQNGIVGCLAEMTRLGYRQQVTYQPYSRFWRLQAYETALFLALAGLLGGASFWWLRHRLA